ncbi:MAG: hypothetical protein ABW221_01380 [Vicinamibacteria bacterium]
MMGGHNWTAAAVVVIGSVLLFGALEWVVTLLAPPEPDDPRLGVAAFWVWACSLALATCFAIPFFEAADGPLEVLSLTSGVIGWLGWKLGVNDGWEDSPREREEIWATSVGAVIGIIARDLIK